VPVRGEGSIGTTGPVSALWRGRALTASGGCLLALILLVIPLWGAWFFFSGDYDNFRHRLAFDSAVWKARSADDGAMWPTRLRMADSLVASRILIGRTRGGVISLLGPPDASTASTAPGELSYLLGPERGWLRIDAETLDLDLDDEGRVRECHTTVH
jgi:hypothetical protein